MKFYTTAVEELRRYKRGWHNRKAVFTSLPDYSFGDILEDINTQRILFDGSQAMTFLDMDQPPPPEVMKKIQPPFDNFYLEFTHPIPLPSPSVQVVANGWPNAYGTEQLTSVLFINKPEEEGIPGVGDIPGTSVAMVFWNPAPNRLHVHTLYLDNSGGIEGISPSKYIEEALQRLRESKAPFSSEEMKVLEATAGEDWDGFDHKFATFWSWVVVYMMAKGISLTSEEPTKKERKRMEAKRTPVKPWHIITVEPTLRQGADAGPSGTSRKHSYRYDVMGHLRFGKHKTKAVDEFGNPVYKHTVEWVSAHQRGVKNMRYVPAVRQFKRGKETHPVFREYMRGEIVEA